MKIKKALLIFGIILQFETLFSQASFTVVPNICMNDPYILTAVTGTMTNCTYTWSVNPNNAIFSTPNGSTSALTLPSSSNCTISLTILSGTLTSSFQATVAGLSSPTINLAKSSSTTCITSNAPLFSKPITLSASGGVSYTWNPASTPIVGNPNGPTNTVRPATTSCFSVTGEGANGCKAMASVCATVIPRFSISTSPHDTLICKTMDNDGVAILKAVLPAPPWIGPESLLTYSWSATNGGILTSPLSKTISVSPSTTSSYTLEMRDSINCVSIPATATVNVENCTGIAEKDKEVMNLKVYPNPVKDKLKIEFDENIVTIDKITITNTLGQNVFALVEPKPNQEMYLSFLPGGVYLLIAESNHQQGVYKFIKE